ncbi:hypothetical protein MESS4_740030 [Mesorhizobium sp. STM 4661]|nr:hypothetical protein MESS4_740030 [Mesorhizobium sp. STM 4661]
MGRHACLGFEGHDHRSDRRPPECRQSIEDRTFGIGQCDIVSSGDARQRVARGNTARRAEDEIEVLRSIVHEVPHLMIDAETYDAGLDMPTQQRRR